MDGSWVDTCMALPFRSSRRKQGSQGGEFQYITTSAGLLRYVDTGGDKPPLLTTPDGPCVIEHLRELIRDLSHDFRVICFDMPGMGFSFPAWRYDFGTKATTDCIAELMDHLCVSKVILAFTCANGLFAMNFAKQYPARVSHLILGQTPSLAGLLNWKHYNIPKLLTLPVAGQILGGLSKRQLAMKWFSLSLPRESEFKTAFQQQAVEAMSHGGCFCLPSLVQAAVRVEAEETKGVQCPVLMVYGDADFSHRHTDFNGLLETIPEAKLIAYPGCGHFPNLERRADYVADVKQFVGCN